MARLWVIGNVALDETFRVATLPAPGASVFGAAEGADVGGKGANQAVVAARFGATTHLTAALGADEAGSTIRAALAAEPLTTILIGRKVATDRSIILATAGGENAIITTTQAAESLRPADVDAALDGCEARDTLLLQGNLSDVATAHALAAGRERGLTTVFNPSPVRAAFARLAPSADIVCVNASEAAALTGGTEDAAIRILRERGTPTVLLTKGAGGAVMVGQDGAVTTEAVRADARDPTGAGDTFLAAALASAVGRAVPLDARALSHGAAAAALTVSRVGTLRAFPTVAEAKTILSRG